MTERERLIAIIEAEGMTSKQFAQEIGVQGGTISNITGGRNNPSLDVMQRVLNRFRTINSDWLILGTGSMYRQTGVVQQKSLFDEDNAVETPVHSPAQSVTQPVSKPAPDVQIIEKPAKTVTKIVVFYSDGSFEER